MSALGRLGRRTDPRAAHAGILARDFSGLAGSLVDAFYANFGYAAPLSLLLHVQSLCAALRPQLVVELGSGLTTRALIGALDPEALVISVDESAEWLGRSAEGLPTDARVVLMAAPGPAGLDYDALELLLAGRRPELVIVDGPSQQRRFSPEAERLLGRLVTPRCAVVVDDTDRPDNDEGAARLAAACSLRKVDYGDPIYTGHSYSLLLPGDLPAPAAVAAKPKA